MFFLSTLDNHRFRGKSYNESMKEINRRRDELTKSKTFSPEVEVSIPVIIH